MHRSATCVFLLAAMFCSCSREPPEQKIVIELKGAPLKAIVDDARAAAVGMKEANDLAERLLDEVDELDKSGAPLTEVQKKGRARSGVILKEWSRLREDGKYVESTKWLRDQASGKSIEDLGRAE